MLSVKRFIYLVGVLQLIFLGLLTIDVNVNEDKAGRAIVGMVWGLIFLWVVVGGGVMWRLRDWVREQIQAIPLNWKLKFVMLATLAALVEEAVAVTMTNLAPLFGVEVGEAYITASANYLDVVALHSVIVFIPMFMAWAWLLGRYDFSRQQVFLIFGLTGMVVEIISFGGAGILNMGLWVYVYGLMLYLAVYSLTERSQLKVVRFYHYPLAILMPILWAIPMAIVINLIHPVNIHFDPI